MQGGQKPLDVAPALEGEDFSILEDFARASSGWFWEMDAQLRFRYMSSVVEDITGVAPEWHYGKTRQDFGIPASVRRAAVSSGEIIFRCIDRTSAFNSRVRCGNG